MTRRSCQTLGPALPPRHERTPVTRCAAGALAPNTSCRRRFAVGASVQDTGVVGAAFGGQRTVAPARTRVNAQHPSKLFSVSSETPNYKSASVLQPRKPGSLSHHQSRGSLQRQSVNLRSQRWYASPSKFEARSRLHERGLTLPSSGQPKARFACFRLPLMSNVRLL